nr:ribonuclease H-like domain-containing protein [Tanacetum cinerariifolium]
MLVSGTKTVTSQDHEEQIRTWVGIPIKVRLLNIYAPQSSTLKDQLWSDIEILFNSIDAVWIAFGDFNVVQCQNESPQVVSAAKLPILNPNEFDLWKMRIEQYFLMTDYSLWEVILNGDSPAPTRVIEGVIQPVAPTTAEQRLARKNELKARGTLLMALLDKYQLKFNIHKDAKTLMEAIEKRFGGNKEIKKVQKTLLKQQYENFTSSSSKSLDQIHDRLQKLTNLEEQSLDDLFNSLKIYEAEVKSSSSASTSTQNIAFVSSQTTYSTNDPVSVFVASAKIPVFAFSNVDTLSNAVECYNCHRKGHFARQCRSPKDTRRNGAAEPQRRTVSVETSTSNALVSQCDGVGSYDWSFQAEGKPTNYALMAFTFSSSFSSNNELADRYHSGDGYHVVPPPYTGTFMPPIPDLVFYNAPNVNETVHTAFNVELSPPKPDNDLSLTHRPSVPIIEDWVFDSEDDSEAEIPQIGPSFVQPAEQVKPPNHSVKLVETSISAANSKTQVVPTAVLTKSKLVPITAARPVTATVLKSHVTRPRKAKPVVTKPHSPPSMYINHSPSPKACNFPPKVTVVKALMVNAVKEEGIDYEEVFGPVARIEAI